MKDILNKLFAHKTLNREEAKNILLEISSGTHNHSHVTSFLTVFMIRNITVEELEGFRDALIELCISIDLKKYNTIDLCGTGGDNLQTFNISTTASFVVAAAGGIVAKHGNRSSSGVSGSADIFEYFGYDLNADPSKIANILENHHICFMFAQKFHPAMKNVSSARKQLGTRTAFNLLGPLSNPANVKNQLVGVFSDDFLTRLPQILKRKGVENIMAVRSNDGMDEFSTSSTNSVCILKNNVVTVNSIDPEFLGLHKSSLNDIKIQTKEDAIQSFVNVLNNSANQSMIETTALNAAGGLLVGNVVDSFEDGIELALNTIKNGKAMNLLEKFVHNTGDIKKLKEIVDG